MKKLFSVMPNLHNHYNFKLDFLKVLTMCYCQLDAYKPISVKIESFLKMHFKISSAKHVSRNVA